MASQKKDDGNRLPWWARTIWVAVGLLGAFLHTMANLSHPWPEADVITIAWPDADLVTMAWLGFAALGVLLPSISSIDFPGGGGVKFRQAIEAGSEGIRNLENALRDATDQVQSWMSSASWLNTFLQRTDVDDDTAAKAVFRYCLERMEEAKDWMGNENEPIRISLWWQDASSGDLFFMFSNDIRDESTINFRFGRNSGLMGQAFAENRLYNLDDAPSSAFYVPIRETQPSYRGLLLIPVRIMDAAVGIISIDREKKAFFGDNAENVAEGLAEQVAFAFTHPRTRTIMSSMPDRVNDLLLRWRVESEQQEPDSTPSPSSGD